MRYVTISSLKEGMVLARPFYGNKFEILLMEGMTLNRHHIQRINELGYAGVYISDEISKDVVTRDIISQELRLATIKAAKDLMQTAEVDTGTAGRSKASAKVTKEKQQQIIMPLIRAIIGSSRRMVDLIDLKPYDGYSYYHAANVVVLSLLLGVEMGITGNQLYELGMAALLHDVGNVFIPKAILNKPDKLTPDEYDIIKSHSEIGFEYLKEHFDISIDACIGALQHHENYDGTGYPNRLKKNKISIYGRIIAITDVYDALTSRRPFRQPMMPPAAMAYMQQKSGNMFDPEIVDALSKIISLYPAGTCVELNSGVRCIVVENFNNAPQRPKLRLINNMSKTPLYIDLLSDPAFKDTKIVQTIEL